MTERQRTVVLEALEAMEALHRADALAGTRAEWRARWARHEKAAAELRAVMPRERRGETRR